MAKMSKAELMEMWEELDPDQNYMEHVEVIPYKHEGSTYGAGGIRLEGTLLFIKAILSHLKDLLSAENDVTRLGLSIKTVTQREDKPGENVFADGGHYALYCKVHLRGGQAQQMHGMLGSHEDATHRFADLIEA